MGIETTIKISEESPGEALLTQKNDNGSVEEKKVAIYDLLSFFQTHINRFDARAGEVMMIPEWLSFIRFYPGNEIHYSAGICVPAGKRLFSYHKERMILPFPGLLFVLEVVGKRLHGGKCFALSGPFKKGAALYVYPFGNVEVNSGRICFGSNQLPPIESFDDLHKVIELFFGSETNDDYFNIKTMCGSAAWQYGTQLGLCDELARRGEFPFEFLRESKATL